MPATVAERWRDSSSLANLQTSSLDDDQRARNDRNVNDINMTVSRAGETVGGGGDGGNGVGGGGIVSVDPEFIIGPVGECDDLSRNRFFFISFFFLPSPY